MADVVVIGAGIVGSSAAYRLAREGVDVVLVDREDVGQATAAGAGIISPGTSFRPPPAFYPLAAKAVEYYGELVDHLNQDGEDQTGFDTVGALYVAMNRDEADQLPGLVETVQQRIDSGVQGIDDVCMVTPKEAKELFPALSNIEQGYYVSGSSRVDGRLMRSALQRAAEKRGATFLRGNAVPVRTGNRITHVDIDGTRVSADKVMISGGAWSSELGVKLEINIPVSPQKGQIVHLRMCETETYQWPVVLGFHTHYIVTFPKDRVVVGATREDNSGFDNRITAGGVFEDLNQALRIAPGLGRATLAETRVGLRPASPDRLPILGPAPEVSNLFLATGHGASGLQLGPYSGAAVADLMVKKAPPIDFSPFSAERFAAS